MRTLAVMLGLAVVALLVCGTDLPDPDIWWNVADGAYRLDHRAAPPDAWFGAHGCLDPLPLVTHVATVALALAYRAGDMWGLILLRALLVACIAAAAGVSVRRRLRGVAPESMGWETLAWAALACGALAARASPRPELLSLTLLAGLAAVCAAVAEGALSPKRGLVLGALVQGVWVHTHGYFVLGPIVAGVACAGALVVDRGTWRRSLFPVAGVALGFLARPSAVVGYTQAAAERELARALGFHEYASTVDAILHGGFGLELACIALLVAVPAVALALALAARSSSLMRRACAAAVALAPFLVLGLDMRRALAMVVAAAPLYLGVVAELPPRVRRALAALAVLCVVVTGGVRLADDPVLHGRRAPDLAPMRLTPIGPARFLAEHAHDAREDHARELVLARMHLGNWLLLTVPQVDVVWTGRRTAALDCAVGLSRALEEGGAAFDALDARIHPAWVLVMHGEQPALVDTLVERGFSLRYLDLRFALFSRAPGDNPLDTNPARMADLENRALDDTIAINLARSACRTLQRAAPGSAGPMCEAAALMSSKVEP